MGTFREPHGGMVVFVGAGPGDPELLTVRAVKIIQQADLVIWAESLVHPGVAALARPDAEVTGSATMTLELISARMIEAAKSTLGALKMVSILDVLGNGLSAVYTFYEPEPRTSYGTYNVLWQIEQTKLLKLPHVYLGYWIGASDKMAYKAQFKPNQQLIDGKWVRAE